MQIGQNNRNAIHYLLGILWFELNYEANKMIPFPVPPNYAYGSFMFYNDCGHFRVTAGLNYSPGISMQMFESISISFN